MSLFRESPRSADLIAQTEVELLIIKNERLDWLIRNRPQAHDRDPAPAVELDRAVGSGARARHPMTGPLRVPVLRVDADLPLPAYAALTTPVSISTPPRRSR